MGVGEATGVGEAPGAGEPAGGGAELEPGAQANAGTMTATTRALPRAALSRLRYGIRDCSFWNPRGVSAVRVSDGEDSGQGLGRNAVLVADKPGLSRGSSR